jgi:hypothetical protein
VLGLSDHAIKIKDGRRLIVGRQVEMKKLCVFPPKNRVPSGMGFGKTMSSSWSSSSARTRLGTRSLVPRAPPTVLAAMCRNRRRGRAPSFMSSLQDRMGVLSMMHSSCSGLQLDEDIFTDAQTERRRDARPVQLRLGGGRVSAASSLFSRHPWRSFLPPSYGACPVPGSPGGAMPACTLMRLGRCCGMCAASCLPA